MIILIAIILSTIACIVTLCVIGTKKRKGNAFSVPKSKGKQATDEESDEVTDEQADSEPSDNESNDSRPNTDGQSSADSQGNTDGAKAKKKEKPVKEKKQEAKQDAKKEKPAPYPTMDGLEEHYLPTKPTLPLRTTPITHVAAKATPSRAPIPTLNRSAATTVKNTAPIPMLVRPRTVTTTAPDAETTEKAEATANPIQQAEDFTATQPVEPVTLPQPAQAQEPAPTAESVEPATIESVEPATIESVQPSEPVYETENMDSEIDFMKNSESMKTPLAAKSLLAATQKMMGINPTEKDKPEPKATEKPVSVSAPATAKASPKTSAKPATKPAPKAAAKPVAKPEAKAAVKPTAKPEAKTAVKPTANPEAKTAVKTAVKTATPATEPKKEEKFTVKKTAAVGKTTEFKASAATFKSLKSPTVKKKKPKSARYTGKWVICRLLMTDYDDEPLEERYFFELRASNGEPLLTSEEYLTYEGAEKGIQTHKENILNDNFRIVLRGNEYVFKLLTAKNTLLCTGTPYKTIERCESAVASAKRFASTAIIQEEPEDVSIRLPDDDDFDTTEIDEAYIKGRWVIQTSGNERIGTVYYFELLDGAGKKLLVSEEYATYEGAVNAVSTYKTNIAKGNFRISVTKRGDYMFKLLGGNNQLLCLGEHFPTRRRCEWAIEVVRAFSRNSAVYKYGEM